MAVKLNHAGVASILKSSDVRAMLTDRAERVLAAAKADSHDDTGAYEASLQLIQDTTDRAVTRVGSDVKYARVLEARYGILSRALDSA